MFRFSDLLTTETGRFKSLNCQQNAAISDLIDTCITRGYPRGWELHHILIEKRGNSIFTDLLFMREDFFIHKQIEYKDKKVFIRVWKRFFKQ